MSERNQAPAPQSFLALPPRTDTARGSPAPLPHSRSGLRRDPHTHRERWPAAVRSRQGGAPGPGARGRGPPRGAPAAAGRTVARPGCSRGRGLAARRGARGPRPAGSGARAGRRQRLATTPNTPFLLPSSLPSTPLSHLASLTFPPSSLFSQPSPPSAGTGAW